MESLPDFLMAIVDRLRVDTAIVFAHDQADNTLVAVAPGGPVDLLALGPQRVPVNQGLTGAAFLSAQTVTSDRYEDDPRGSQVHVVWADSSGAAFPIENQDKVVGVLLVAKRERGFFAPAVIDELSAAARDLGIHVVQLRRDP